MGRGRKNATTHTGHFSTRVQSRQCWEVHSAEALHGILTALLMGWCFGLLPSGLVGRPGQSMEWITYKCVTEASGLPWILCSDLLPLRQDHLHTGLRKQLVGSGVNPFLNQNACVQIPALLPIPKLPAHMSCGRQQVLAQVFGSLSPREIWNEFQSPDFSATQE